MTYAQIFQLFGISFIVIGLGMFVSPENYKKFFARLTEEIGVIFLGGIMALITGYLLINFYNVWEWSFKVIITIFGWLSFFKGLLLLVFPTQSLAMCSSMARGKNFMNVIAWVLVVLGVVLLYISSLAFS